MCNEETARRQLIENVLYATSIAEGRTIVILTMRADFYGQCASYPGLRAAISDHQSLIGPLSEEELREVIETPAQLAGGELEAGLMELLLSDMKGQAGALPFLGDALFKLWENRDGRRLTAKSYMDMGRLGGALDAHAEEFFMKSLTLEEQKLCHQLLLDLVHPGESAADTKKRVAIDDVASTEASRVVLKKLADARLVTTTGELETAQAELAHEALIGGWRRLGRWVNENREKSRLKERLLESAREWQKNRKGEDFLYRGTQLAATEESFGPSAQSLQKLAREFLEASVAKRNREKRERHREQEEKELQQQRELEKQRQYAEKQTQAASKLRRFAWVLAVVAFLLILAIGAGILAFYQRNAALRKTNEIGSRANVSLARYSIEAGDDAQALARLAQALRLNPKNYSAVASAASILAQTSFALPIAPVIRSDKGTFACFSPDIQRVVTTSWDKTARLWDAATGAPVGEAMKHGKGVTSAAFSPDGRQVVTTSWDKTARLWDATTGKEIGEPMKHDDCVTSASFSPDGQRVVTASWDKTARLWDVTTGKEIGEPMNHGDGVTSAALSPDGKRVVTASLDQTAQLWDATTGKPLGEPMKHKQAAISAAFSPDGQRVVTASWDTTARLWDAATGEEIGEPMHHESGLKSAAFSPDGQRVITASGKAARVWDVPAIHGTDTPKDIGLLADLAEASGGLTLQTSGEAEVLKTLTPMDVKAKRDEINAKFARKTSGLTHLQRLLKWSALDARKRTISPFSDITVPNWIENRIRDGTVDGLRAAILVDPSNARLAANFGKALADNALRKGTDPNEARLATMEADFQTHRALELAPNNDEVKRLRAEVVQLLRLQK